MFARRSFKPSYEFLLNEFRARPGRYPLGAGASAGEAPFGENFMQYDLGYFDLEQKTLQPLDNPFGPRLSPMS
jgi:hypothetical protein